MTKSSTFRSQRLQSTKRLLRAAIVATPAVAAVLYFPHAASAANLYWDSNGATAGAGATPTGTWGTSAFWTSDSTGSSATGAYVAGSTAIFSAGSDAVNAYSVTIASGSTQTAVGLTVKDGILTLVQAVSSNIALGAGTVTINTGATLRINAISTVTQTAGGGGVVLNGGTLECINTGAAGSFWTANGNISLGTGGGTLKYDVNNTLNIYTGVISGAAGNTLTKSGVGVLALAGLSTYSGDTVVNAGELRVRTNNNVLPTGTNLTVTSPGIFNLNNQSQQVASITGNGQIGTGSGTLTLNQNVDTTFSGNIKNIANAGASGVTTGNGRIIKNGTGTLTMAGTNDLKGSITVNAGGIVAPSGSVLCDAICDITVNTGGTLTLSNGSQTIENLAGTGGSVVMDNGYVLTMTMTGAPVYSGVISGGGSIIKSGSGTEGFAGANTYTGNTTVNAGNLRVTNTTGSGTGTGNVIVNGGVISGTGSIAGSGVGNALTVNTSAHVTPGIGGGNSTLSAVSADLESGSHLDVALGTSLNSDKLNVTGANGLTLNGGTVHVTTTNGFTNGQYTAIKYSGAYSGAFANLAAATQAGFDSITLVDNLANQSIDVSVVVTSRNWVLDSNVSNDWSTGVNWGANPTAPNGPGAIANFGSTPPDSTVAHVVNMDASQTVGVLNLNNAGGYTLSGPGTLNLDTWGADGQINVISGSHTISSPVGVIHNTNVAVTNSGDTLTFGGSIVNSGGLIKSGAGSVVASGVISGTGSITTTGGTFSPSVGNTYTGKNFLNGGTVVITGDTALGAAPTAVVADNITFNGGKLQTAGGTPFTIVANRGVTISAGGGTIDTITDVTLNGITAGSGNLTKSGAGTLTLGAANNGTGKFIINGGTVAFGGGGGANIGFLGAASPTSFTADLLTINGGKLQANNTASGSFNANRGLTIGASGATIETTNGTLTFNGAISGSSTITKSGAATSILVLASTTSSYTGKYVVTAGELNPNNNDLGFGAVPAALVPDSITLNGGNIRGSASFTVGANRGITIGAGGGQLHQVTAGTMSVNAPITGSGALSVLTSTNSIIVSLNADNSNFTGSFTLAGGRVNLNHNFAAGPATTVINVSDAAGLCVASTLGAGTITTANPFQLNNVTAANPLQLQVNSGGTWIQTGQIAGGGAMYRDNTGAGTIVLAGNNTFTGGMKIIDRTLTLGNKNALGTNTFLVGDATVAPAVGISFSSNTDLTGANAVPNAVSLVRNATVNGGTDLELAGVVSGTAGLTKSGTGTLVLSNANTYSGATVIAQGVLAIPASSALGDGSGTNTLTFSGGTLKTTAGIDIPRSASLTSTGGAVDTAGNTSSFSGVLSGTGAFTKLGAGSLVLSSDNTYSGLTNINAGTLSVASSAKLGNASGTNGVAFGGGTLQATGAIASGARNVTLNTGGGTVDTNGNAVAFGAVAGVGAFTKAGVGALTVNSVRSGNLSVTGGTLAVAANGTATGVNVVNATSITGGAQLDLSDNHLVDKTTGVGSWNGSNYTGLSGLVAAGRNGGTWTGSGIVTSQTQAAGSNFTTLGIATAGQVKGIAATDTAVWAGQTVTGSDSLVMYTYGGDANLDGKINVDDYTRIDFNVPLGVAGWYNGDFNYDGKINVDDYTIIDFNVGIQGAPFFTAGGSEAALGVTGGVSGVTAVPEPASLGVVTMVAAGLLGRRRRKI